MTQLVLSNSLQSYLAQVNRFPLLSADEEFELAVRFKQHNDLNAAHKLIASNLRFVVKIAVEYRNYGLRVADLIQEGNIGLMKAVKKFDPYKGYRLITYAVWWIRSHIQAFILKNWSLVNKGTAALKKRLFYRLNKNGATIESLEKHDAQRVFVKPDVIDAECRDVSLNNEIGDEETTYLDMLTDPSQNQEDTLAMAEDQRIVKAEVSNALQVLNEKERYVVEHRMMAEPTLTLQEIGDRLAISRERVRQIEGQALKKLKQIKGLKALANNL
ncbi:MAG: RNA polymerase factor sigma-32 [Deltaproteobacteria bacterium]|nr:RNA polymerase factor sigma-32 [Deltaproteobacteria bacterium]MBI3755240.1 RNA polymerase factor sigma-32 [Deltaproteobacteria bacterium]